MSAYAHPIQFAWQGIEETTGVSPESEALTQLLADVDRHLASAVSAGAAIEQTTDEVLQVFTEAADRNWDGYGAEAVSAETLVEALAFASAIPPGVASPAVVPEPTGEIGLEWSKGTAKQFVVSLSGSSTAVFAGLLGGGTKVHGVDRFLGAVPPEIRQILLRHFPARKGEARAA